MYNRPESLIYNDAKDLVKLTTSEYERDSHKEEKTRWKNERRMLEEIQQATGGTDAMLAEVRQTMQGMQEQLYAKENGLRQLRTQLSRSQSQLSQTQSQLSQLERSHAEAVEDLDTGQGVIQSLVQAHAIELFSRDSSLKGLLLKDSAVVRSPSIPSRQLFSPPTSFTPIAPSTPTQSISTLPIDNVEYTSPEVVLGNRWHLYSASLDAEQVTR
ncbi:hypothetical protein DFH05DRAFT_1591538, partial [Lentinula detonsa]